MQHDLWVPFTAAPLPDLSHNINPFLALSACLTPISLKLVLIKNCPQV